MKLTTRSDDLRDDGSEWERRYCATDEDGERDRFYEVLDKAALREAERAAAKQRKKRVRLPFMLRGGCLRLSWASRLR